MANVIFKYGSKELYNALQQKDTNTLYWLTDTKEVYKGEGLFGTGREATADNAGLMSAADKAKLDSLAAGTVAGLTAVDATIVIADGADGGKTIGVQVSAEEGNLIQTKADGLFVAVDNQVVEQAATEAANTAINEFATNISDDGTVNTFKELVDYVAQHGPEAADMAADITALQEQVAAIDLSKYVLERIEGTNGTALIQNEVTGGGAKFWHSDGTESFIGVNDGGENGMVAQIYADKNVDGQWIGSRINVYRKGIFYHNMEDKASGNYVADDPAHEIATKGDISALETTITESLTWGAL